MMRLLPLLIGVAAVTGSAIDSGRQAGRWGKSDDLPVVAERLKQFKADLGDWRSEPRELDARQMEVAGVASYVSRLYVNRKNGEKLQMLLICGRPGPISVHEPDVCYTNAGYVRTRDLDKVAMGDNEFKAGTFEKGPPQPDSLRIVWGWTTDGQWKAPTNPRQAFGRDTSALLKLYIIRQTGPDDGTAAKEPATEFLSVLIPELKRCLAPSL
jgi:Protein of unknown function (DUF3485)